MIFLLFIGGGLLAALIYLTWTESAPKYYASTTTGNVIPIQSLSSPMVTLPLVEKWAAMVARSAYSLNFLTYEKQLAGAKQYFTPDGWASFESAINSSGYLDTVKSAKLDVSTVVNGPVVPVSRYIDHGRYTWVVQMPVLVLYTSASTNVQRQFYVTLTIKRVPELDVARGISVTKFISRGAI